MEDVYMYVDYVIQNGDTLESIALATNIPMYQLLSINGLEDALTLMPGNTIKIPNNYGNLFVKYTVQKGDSLSSIAKEYQTTIKILEELNGLENSNFLYEGEQLLIPREDVGIYITKEADTLESVAQNLNKPISELTQYNKRIYLLPSQLIAYKK